MGTENIQNSYLKFKDDILYVIVGTYRPRDNEH